MRSHEDPRALTVRTLLASTGTPFVVADFGSQGVIFRQGDPCDSVMQLASGRVRLAVTDRSGKEAICGILDAGAFLGEEALAGETARRQTAIAITVAEVLVVAKTHMMALLRTQWAIADRFIAHILARHAHLEADLSDQLLHSSEQRLARTLLVLAGCDGGRQCRCVLPDISQELIAEMVGTTRSRVSLFMGKFKRLGFIQDVGERLTVSPSLRHIIHDGNRGVPNGTARRSSAVRH